MGILITHMRLIRQLSQTLLLMATWNSGFAQKAAGYSFRTSVASFYTSISGLSGAVTVPIACDDCSVTHIPVGFRFRFCGVDYDTISATSNGYLSLIDTSLTHHRNLDSNITHKGFIMPFWDDLTGVPHAGLVIPPACHYLTAGMAPDRVFTFEWQGFNKNMTGCTTCGANFQVKLYETSNAIEFIYGPSGYTTMSGSIGIANSYKDWQVVSSVTTPLTTSAVFTDTLSSFPANGKIYRWEMASNEIGNVEQSLEPQLTIFPNPNRGRFSINFNDALNEECVAVLTDMKGSQISRFDIKTNNSVLQYESIPRGVYLLKVYTSKFLYSRCLVVE